MGSSRVVIIGAGPAGYSAAIRASQLGMDVVLVEKDRVGGTCTNRGCIPTKALLSVASLIKRLRSLTKKGILTTDLTINVNKVLYFRDSVVSRLVKGIEYLLRKYRVQLVGGEAKLVSMGKVLVGDESISYDKLIIATGSTPVIPSISGVKDVNALSGDEFVNTNEVPQKLLILGGGFIGVELAQIFRVLGSEVHVVEVMPRILPTLDSELSSTLQKVLSRDGIVFHVNTSVSKFERVNEGYVAYLTNGTKLNVDKVVIAVGRKPNTVGLGLENIGISLGSRGEVLVNEHMETSVSGVYAAGDVTGKYFLAYTAFEEGLVAAENASGINSRINYSVIPIAVFTDPEVASVGLSEDEARKFSDVIVVKFPLIANGRALTLDSYEGFVKVITSKSGKLLGVHVVGPEASELIHIASLVISRGGYVMDLLNTIYIHPTLSEAIKEAALLALGKAIHV